MDLAALVPSLRRAVAPPGEFDTYFPNTLDADLSALLADAVAEAQLDGFLGVNSLDLDAETVTPGLSNAEQALVVLYGSYRVLQVRVTNLKNHTRYKAGSAEAETEQSASVLVELLRQARDRKKQILDDAKIGRASTSFSMVDLYVAKSIDLSSPDVTFIAPFVDPTTQPGWS